jgi:hypothetical protein
MQLQRTAATAFLVGALSIAATGVGSAHAEPSVTTPPPSPVPSAEDGPGANVGAPGNPTAPGRDILPPPGRTGPVPQDAVVPMWAPPAPPPPWWAPWLPVVWNTELNAWGVWWNGSFQRLP